jgi:ubiquinone/menaquinone biosynthesis C-methylase UbiE
MSEIDLLEHYPKTQRKVEERGQEKTEEDRLIARKFGQEYFDGDRRYGYGGYSYQARFWQPVVPTFIDYYGIDEESSILDVGCGKGFMLHDFALALPEATLKGIDISEYAVTNAVEKVKSAIAVGNAKELPFEDKSFDLVVSINTIHNLPIEECKQALREIQRVSRRDAFITVDAYRTPEEKKRMDDWNLTAQTYMHVDEWKKLFKEVGYEGDYFWFIP